MPRTDAGDSDELFRVYDLAAVEEAKVAGLCGAELEGILRGRAPTDMVPPLAGEEPLAYADRAVSEFLILYITRWHGGGTA